MKVEFPFVIDGKYKKKYNPETNEYEYEKKEIEVKEDDYFKSFDDFKDYCKKYDIDLLNDHEYIKSQIQYSKEHKKIVKLLLEDKYRHIENNINITLKDIMSMDNMDFKTECEPKANDLLELNKLNQHKSSRFLKDNEDRFDDYIEDIKKQKYEELKAKWREASKRYYDKIRPKVIEKKVKKIDEEEKKERKRLANKKYYEKNKKIKEESNVEC